MNIDEFKLFVKDLVEDQKLAEETWGNREHVTEVYSTTEVRDQIVDAFYVQNQNWLKALAQVPGDLQMAKVTNSLNDFGRNYQPITSPEKREKTTKEIIKLGEKIKKTTIEGSHNPHEMADAAESATATEGPNTMTYCQGGLVDRVKAKPGHKDTPVATSTNPKILRAYKGAIQTQITEMYTHGKITKDIHDKLTNNIERIYKDGPICFSNLMDEIKGIRGSIPAAIKDEANGINNTISLALEALITNDDLNAEVLFQQGEDLRANIGDMHHTIVSGQAETGETREVIRKWTKTGVILGTLIGGILIYKGCEADKVRERIAENTGKPTKVNIDNVTVSRDPTTQKILRTMQGLRNDYQTNNALLRRVLRNIQGKAPRTRIVERRFKPYKDPEKQLEADLTAMVRKQSNRTDFTLYHATDAEAARYMNQSLIKVLRKGFRVWGNYKTAKEALKDVLRKKGVKTKHLDNLYTKLEAAASDLASDKEKRAYVQGKLDKITSEKDQRIQDLYINKPTDRQWWIAAAHVMLGITYEQGRRTPIKIAKHIRQYLKHHEVVNGTLVGDGTRLADITSQAVEKRRVEKNTEAEKMYGK